MLLYCLYVRGGGNANAFFSAFFFLSQGGDFFLHLLHFLDCFASVLPSVSFYCGNPWTNLCHMHHFYKGGAKWKCIYLHFFASNFLQPHLAFPPTPLLYVLLANIVIDLQQKKEASEKRQKRRLALQAASSDPDSPVKVELGGKASKVHRRKQ